MSRATASSEVIDERELLEADDVGEDDRDVVVVLRDGVVAVLVAVGHPSGMNDRMSRSFARSCSSMRCDLTCEAAAHVVEGGGDVGELVARAGIDLHALVARGDPLRRGLEPAQRPHEDLREHEREQADEDDHAGGREDEVAGEVLDRDERFGRGLLRDDHPVQSVDVQRGVRREAVATEVVALEQRAALAGERGVTASPVIVCCRSVLPFCTLSAAAAGDEPRGDSILLVDDGVVMQLPRDRAHGAVAADEVGLAGLPEAVVCPTRRRRS